MIKPLSTKDIRGIIGLLLQDINKRISDREISLRISEEALAFITEAAYDPVYGARPLKRYLQKNVETLLAKKILADEVSIGDSLMLDVLEERLVIRELPSL